MAYVTQITVPALPEYVAVVRLAATGILARMNFTAEQIEDIKIALSEACTNAVQYAYPKKKKGGCISVTLSQKPKALEICVKDTGCGFDPDNPPQRAIKDDDIHMGLGLVFMKSLMDDVSIVSKKKKGTTITLIKKVK
jgi:serine/threonine-protein kinase RsbW